MAALTQVVYLRVPSIKMIASNEKKGTFVYLSRPVWPLPPLGLCIRAIK